jgi:outer membrane immunogenic protein
MRRIWIAGAFAIAAGGHAFAADLPQPAPPPPRAPAAYVPTVIPIYNWSGFYIGLNAGGSYVTQGAPTNTVATTIDPAFPAGTAFTGVSTSSTGFAGGGQIGGNFQTGQFVFGLEADVDYLSNKATVQGTETSAAGVIIGTNQHDFTLDLLSTIRGRVGVAFDRLLVYGTGGFAMGEYQAQRTQLTGVSGTATAGTVETYNDLRLGWAAGGGLEYAVTENVTLRAEYLFADLETLSYTFPIANRTQVVPNEYVSIARGGVNFKFGGF